MTDNLFPGLQMTGFRESHDAPDQSKEKLLPRLAWSNQLTYLKAIMKAKRALDQIEAACPDDIEHQ